MMVVRSWLLLRCHFEYLNVNLMIVLNNHPFVDGNKCVAFFSTDVFLRINGYKMTLEPKAAYAFLMGLFDTNDCDLDHLAPWIRSSITPL